MVFAGNQIYTLSFIPESQPIEFLGSFWQYFEPLPYWLLVQNILSFVTHLLQTRISELDPVFQRWPDNLRTQWGKRLP